MLVHNPYNNINWSQFNKVISLNHIHETVGLQSLYEKGVRHLPFSPYYPSDPNRYYPLHEKLDGVPFDLMSSPNAEHHHVTDDGLTGGFHFIGLGSFFASGSPTGQDPVGLQDSWRNSFTNVFNHLQYEDGGGVIIAHPNSLFAKWRSFSTLMEMLDYDDRVLGIEIYSHSSTRRGYADDGSRIGTAFNIWDEALKTGRMVYGYCTIDHAGFDTEGLGLDLGRNILLVPEMTEHDCLKAYRTGASYGALHGNRYSFTDISATDLKVNVTLDDSVNIKFITDKGIVQENNSNSAEYNVKDDDIYVRIEATKEDETLYSQAIMYKTQEEAMAILFEKERAIARKKTIRNLILLS